MPQSLITHRGEDDTACASPIRNQRTIHRQPTARVIELDYRARGQGERHSRVDDQVSFDYIVEVSIPGLVKCDRACHSHAIPLVVVGNIAT